MQHFGQLALILTCLIALYVGARTLWIWRRTRHVAEFAIGWNVLGIAIGGVILTALSVARGDAAPTASILYAIGLLGMVVHIAALYVGTWKIFRGGARWPLGIVTAATLVAGFWMVHTLVSPGITAWRSVMLLTVRDLGMVWAAFEGFRYSGMLRKRVALGLAEPIVAHRIWLWAVGAALQVIVLSLDLGTWFATGAFLMASPLGLFLAAGLGLIGAWAIAFAFFPPSAYVKFISRQSEPTAAAETH